MHGMTVSAQTFFQAGCGQPGWLAECQTRPNAPSWITHRGKPPALPGDSPGFDLYDGRCEFLISTKRKEIHDERISEPEPYEVGL
jgi:hypothetical protein